MGLDPKLLYSLPNNLVDMYGLVEIDILRDMARRISTYDYFIPAAQHQNQLLQELGMSQETIIEKLSALTGQTQTELVELLSEAGAEAVADDLEYYTAAEVYEPSKVNKEALHAQLNAGLLQTQQSFFNITRTTANTASKQFERALDRAWTQINVGGMDYNTAITNAIKDLARDGIGSIEYKSGRIDNIEVAVRRAVVTGANQTAMRTQETLADELEVDLVEVTAHGGARPSHAKWQGKVFSRNGRVTIDGVTYEDLKKATGYGTAGGLGGINCRHNFHPYIPGTSRAWSNEALEKLEEKKIIYNGEPYTEYEASQIQRGIERNIRKAKREVEALEAVGLDSSEARKILRENQKTYTDFTEQTGIRKQTARTQIGTAKAQRAVNNAQTPAPAAQNTNNVLTNTGNNGIINMNRQTKNVGAFSDLQERTSKKNVRAVAKEFGIDLKGLSITVDKNEELLALDIAGSANSGKVGEITFLPNAFRDKETLIRTLFHEKHHVEQYKKYGVEFVTANATRFEHEAYEAEEKFIEELKQRGVL